MRLLTLPVNDAALRASRAKALVFEDPVSQRLLAQIEQVAPSEATVLITGETGTGKEIVARHIHELSPRRHKPFVAVNCGAFSESLVESDLFGHERGAFTGAIAAKAGWFEAAHGGTLFLDEIGELQPSLQVKLLRVLQEREVVRLGSRQPIPLDIRLITATNANLAGDVVAGRFRADLFYRLNVAGVTLAPLRDRPGDIVPLAEYFLGLYSQRLGAVRTTLSPAALERLLQHPWPGNIRELENVIHHALMVCRGSCITPEELRLTTLPAPTATAPATVPAGVPAGVPARPPAAAPGTSALEAALLALFEQNPPNLYQQVEETLLRTAYRFCDRNQLQTARLLGISRNIVRARLIQCGELAGGSPRASSAARAVAAVPQATTVRIGYQKFGLLILLKARGSAEKALRRRGIRVEWVEFPGGTQMVEALQAGRIDLGIVGEVPPIFAQAAQASIVYLAAEPPAPEEEAIVVHAGSPIHTVADLKGKTVALNRGANVDYLLVRALEEAHLTYEDIKVAFVPPTGARAAFESHEVDAWAIWNPLLASITYNGRARVLRDGTGLTTNTAYYVSVRSFADAHPEVVETFLAEVRATGEWANAHTDAVVDLLAPELGLPRPAVAAAFARSRFGARPLDAVVLASQQQVADTLYRQKLIPRPVTVSEAQWVPPQRASQAI